MHKVFISFHHADLEYKDALVSFNQTNQIFIDRSVDTGEISDALSDQEIREKIRDDYLRDTTVTVLLVGENTRGRKHVDWEIYSSMIDGKINKKSGILVILLPNANPGNTWTAAHTSEKSVIYSDCKTWMSVTTRTDYEDRYPFVPRRIIDNLLNKEAKVSVAPWSRLTAGTLSLLLENAFEAKSTNKYDLSRPMRRANTPL